MKKIIIILVVTILFLTTLSFIPKKSIEKDNEVMEEVIMYSWNINNVMSNQEEFEKIKEEYKINTIYQDFDSSFFLDEDNSFMKYMDSLSLEVFQLSGDPSWGRADGFSKIKKEIDRVYEYNKKHKFKIKGVILDIEPYTSEKIEKFSNPDFLIYVNEIKKAYQYSKEKELEMRLSIPYWLDHIDYDLLEQLIENTDGISVMNYNIDKTEISIKEEYELAMKYNKKIDTVYEINYGKKNYFASLDDILNDFDKLQEAYPNLAVSYHHLKSIMNNN